MLKCEDVLKTSFHLISAKLRSFRFSLFGSIFLQSH